MMLEIKDVFTSYGGIQALRGVNLVVDKGAMVALVGSNGAGKTTLLNTISGSVPAHSGSILFQGQEIVGSADYHIARKGLIQVPEGRRILGSLSVEENLQLGALAAGDRMKSQRDALAEVYAMFPVLAERRTSMGGVLSGGQQQMLAIGRALMGRPHLLLLDEPSLGLAPIIVEQVFRALAQLNRSGLTILLVEQNARRALELTSYAYVLDHGAVVREGPSSEVAADPAIIDHYLGRERRNPLPAS
jgi:branched-chain amino acid transport system ATP-binding protein